MPPLQKFTLARDLQSPLVSGSGLAFSQYLSDHMYLSPYLNSVPFPWKTYDAADLKAGPGFKSTVKSKYFNMGD